MNTVGPGYIWVRVIDPDSVVQPAQYYASIREPVLPGTVLRPVGTSWFEYRHDHKRIVASARPHNERGHEQGTRWEVAPA
jgi:hypothetical protein